MAKQNIYAQSFNTGVQDKTALPRTDLERMRLAAEIQTNFLCKATGPAFMRPGLGYIGSALGSGECLLKPFVFGATDAALLAFSNNSLSIILDDEPLTRVSVSSTITNGDFSSATGWNTVGSNGGQATISGGVLTLNAVFVNATAMCNQTVATASPGIEHALRIFVSHGPVQFRCGVAVGGQDLIPETTLPTGYHSLAFTPPSTAYSIRFSSTNIYDSVVDSIMVEGSGIMALPSPWTTGDLGNIRISQSADVCFIACNGVSPRRIERRGRRSWSVAFYLSDDGPFVAPTTQTIRLTTDGLNGNANLFSDTPFFNTGHVGGIFRLDQSGQYIQQSLSSEDSFSDPIRVTGVNNTSAGGENDRDFLYTIAGTWSGTISLQRSFDSATTGFKEVDTETANVTDKSYSDDDDNSIYWYRLGFAEGNFTSGAALVALGYDGGGGYGICRVTAYIGPTQVSIEILKPFLKKGPTRDWREGEWSDDNGWPSAVTLSDGRLWWSGDDRLWGSVSDAFASFNEEVEGDSGPIARSIATGGVNATQWLLSLQRLLAGTEGVVATVKSSSLDEPLTPSNLGVKDSSTTGAAAIDPAKIDTRGIFVERSGTALLELTFDGGSADYVASEISKLTTDIFASGIKQLAVQRRPDTRIWIVLNDGSAVCFVYEADDKVAAFIPITTDGLIESVAVLPALTQDRVYFCVNRTISGSSVRYIEKMAMDSEVKPATLCKVMDAFKAGVNSPASTTVNVGMHLVGASVVVWADGAPLETSPGVPATFTVNGSGNITVPSAVTNWVAGLPYTAQYKSARLAYGAQGGTAMLQKKTIDSLGLILTDFVRSGIRYGHSFDDPYRGLFPMPQMADGKIQPNVVLSTIRDEESFPFPGEWNTDSRLCLQVSSPYTATFLGIVMGITTNG